MVVRSVSEEHATHLSKTYVSRTNPQFGKTKESHIFLDTCIFIIFSFSSTGSPANSSHFQVRSGWQYTSLMELQ